MEVKRKKCKVVMLPAKNESHVVLLRNRLGFDPSLCKHKSGQHLYIISDDKIKEGDWYYSGMRTKEYGVHLCDSKRLAMLCNEKNNKCNKIIATTDSNLGYLECVCNGDTQYCNGKCKIDLPQPSQAFIEKYCKLGGIDKVIVEYVNLCLSEEYEHPNPKLRQKELCTRCQEDCNLIPKVNSHNEITIHPIKNSWSRKEMEEIHISIVKEGYKIDGGKDWSKEDEELIKSHFNKWMDKNS